MFHVIEPIIKNLFADILEEKLANPTVFDEKTLQILLIKKLIKNQ